jgi:hypothetical protein
MSYSVVVEDRYAWYINPGINPWTGQPDSLYATGQFDDIMARLDATGRGENFPVGGEASVITVNFNERDCVVFIDHTGEEKQFYNFGGEELPQYVRDRFVRECDE